MSQITLTKKQTLALDALETKGVTEVLFGGGAGGAKSFFGCLWIITSALSHDGSRWLIGRAKLAALKQTTLVTFFEVAKLCGLIADVHFKYNAQSNEIKFHNGSVVILKDLFLYPSDPNFDSLGSLEVTGIFIDEVNQLTHKAVEVAGSRIRYKLDEFGIEPKILMSCNPAKNWVYHEFYSPHTKGTLKEYRRFIQALAVDNPNISKHYIENLKKMNEASKQRLLFGNWDYEDDPTKIFDFLALSNLTSNTFIPSGTKYITCDPARLGVDKTIIYVWDGWRVIHRLQIDKSTLDFVYDEIEKLREKFQVSKSNVVVDVDGLGSGLVDFGKYQAFANNSNKNIDEKYRNLRSHCYFEIAKKVNKNEIYIDDSKIEKEAIEKLIYELSLIKDWNSDKDEQKSQIIPKDKIKEESGCSPDDSDSFMMRIFFEIRIIRTFSSGNIGGSFL